MCICSKLAFSIRIQKRLVEVKQSGVPHAFPLTAGFSGFVFFFCNFYLFLILTDYEQINSFSLHHQSSSKP